MRASSSGRVITVILILLTMCASASNAATIHVPGDQPTIQAGIDAAAAGDTVLVSAGIYTERVRVIEKSIVLRSESGPAATTISGGGVADTAAVVALLSFPDASVIEGFTVTGGMASAGGGGIVCGQGIVRGNRIWGNVADGGAGLEIWGAALVVGNTIEDNEARLSGGGILIFSSEPTTIVDNVIRRNRAVGAGGGIYSSTWSPEPTVRGNLITDNMAEIGGGIWAGNTMTLEDNTFLGNRAEGIEGAGGGAFFIMGHVTLRRNLLVGNAAGKEGGGICMVHFTDFVFENCTLVANSAPSGSAFSPSFGTGTFSHNIVAGNNGGIAIDCDIPYAERLSFDCCDVWGNPAGSYGGACSDPTGTAGNFSEDPRFCDPSAGDYTLRADSPCFEGYGCGLIGALGQGCGATAVERKTWGAVKTRFD